MPGMKNKYVIKMIENTTDKTKQNKEQQDKSANSKKVLARELLLNLSEEKKTIFNRQQRLVVLQNPCLFSAHTWPRFIFQTLHPFTKCHAAAVTIYSPA